MSKVFKKMNLKDQQRIVVIDAPPSFESEIDLLDDVEVVRSIPRNGLVQFAVAFVKDRLRLDELAQKLSAAAEGDAIVWFAYPKKLSKKYTCDFDRDSGWEVLGQAGFEGVRAVAIDEDWSALRFRRTEFIKSMTRDSTRAMSAAGKKRVAPGPQED